MRATRSRKGDPSAVQHNQPSQRKPNETLDHTTGAELDVRGIALCLGLAALSLPPRRRERGTDTVRSLYDTLLSTMRNGPTLGRAGATPRSAGRPRVFDIRS